jgi:hypothetical protein
MTRLGSGHGGHSHTPAVPAPAAPATLPRRWR